MPLKNHGPKEYKHLPFKPDSRYELRGQYERFKDGTLKTVWRAFYRGFPVYEIVKSQDPNLVYADLEEWLKESFE